MKPYTRIKCTNCDGHGVVSDYGAFGHDFYGPDECDECEGSGRIIRYVKSGVLAKYPGGPLLGRDRPSPVSHPLVSERVNV